MPQPSAVTRSASSLFSRTLAIEAFSAFSTLPRSGRIAWRVRSRPCLAEPPAESPSTMKISVAPGVLIEQSRELAGQRQPGRGGALADHFLLRGAAGLAGARGEDGARDDLLGDRLLAVQPVLERRPHLGVDRGEDLGVVQAILGLALELRLLDEDAEHGDQALAQVLGGQRHALRRQVVRLDVVADRLAEAGAEAVLVGAAGAGGDAVDVAADVLVGRLGPLQRELDADVAVAPVAGQRERRLVDGALVALDDQPIQVGDDAVLVDEGVARAGRLLDEGQLDAAVQVARRLEALAQQRGVELDASGRSPDRDGTRRWCRCRAPGRSSTSVPCGFPA